MENIQESDNILLDSKISSLFLKFTIPGIISMIMTGTQAIIDGLFVGNVLGSNGMASINIASPVLQIIFALAMVVTIGGQSYMGIKLGEGNTKKAQDVFKTLIIFIFIVGGCLTLIGFFFNNQIAMLLGADDMLIENVATYIKIISLFTIPISIMYFFGFTGRLLGKPQIYVRGVVLSLFSNIILNYIMIYKLNLGVFGAATATGLAYCITLLVVMIPVLDRKSCINIYHGEFDKKVIVPVLYNGSSEGISSISAAISAFIFNTAFMSMVGADGVAAFTAINYIGTLGTFLMFGISDGIAPIISYNFGNNNNDRVAECMKLGIKSVIFIGIMVFSVLTFFGKDLINLFINDNIVVYNLAAGGSKIYAITFLFIGYNLLISGYFTSIGNALFSIIMALSRGLIFIVIGRVVLPLFFDIYGIWMCIPFAEICTAFIGMRLKKISDNTIHTMERK